MFWSRDVLALPLGFTALRRRREALAALHHHVETASEGMESLDMVRGALGTVLALDIYTPWPPHQDGLLHPIQTVA